MAARPAPRVPAPLSCAAFLRASHFQLGFDRRPEGSTVFSPYRVDYPPRWGRHRREPILPPKCAGVLNQDMDPSWDTRSTTYVSYPPWPLAPRPGLCPPASHLQMHVDPRNACFASVTRESFPCPPRLPHILPNRVDKWDDNVPCGDKAKEALPESLYQQSYPAHEGTKPPDKARSQHLGGDSTLKGDGRPYFHTSYQSEYVGESGPPAQSCKQLETSIPFGDPRFHQPVSEQKHAYVPLKADGQRYDAERAAAQVHCTNVQPGDGQHRFSTIMAESYPWKDPGPPFVSSFRKNESSVLRGDRDPERNMEDASVTLYRLHYREPSTEDLVHASGSQAGKDRLPLRLGDGRFAFFETTQHAEYRPPLEAPRGDPRKRSAMLQSHVPFDSLVTHTPTTTTQDMLVPHQMKKYQLTEEEIQRIKTSHIVHPWEAERWFSTEQKDAYTDKYCGPITLTVGDLQRSSLPLGTMPRYAPRRPQALGDSVLRSHLSADKLKACRIPA